jgi:hypothetical protein
MRDNLASEQRCWRDLSKEPRWQTGSQAKATANTKTGLRDRRTESICNLRISLSDRLARVSLFIRSPSHHTEATDRFNIAARHVRFGALAAAPMFEGRPTV